MSEIRTFRLKNPTKFSFISDVRSSDVWAVWAVWFFRSFGYTINVKNPNKFEHSVGQVDQPNVQNLKDSTTEPKQKAPESDRSDFGS